jgi:hypothetical protein
VPQGSSQALRGQHQWARVVPPAQQQQMMLEVSACLATAVGVPAQQKSGACDLDGALFRQLRQQPCLHSCVCVTIACLQFTAAALTLQPRLVSPQAAKRQTSSARVAQQLPGLLLLLRRAGTSLLLSWHQCPATSRDGLLWKR